MHYEDDRPATEAEAHVEWHLNSGVPMGTPGCPQDTCHLPEPHDEEEDVELFHALRPITEAQFTHLVETGELVPLDDIPF